MPDLLIELFSEEIPARMQARAAEDLKKRVTDGLVEAGLTYAGAAAFSTPRRLTLAVEGMLAETPILKDEKKGPSIDANIKAIAGYMRSLAIEAPENWYLEQIEHLKDGGVLSEGANLIRVSEVKGKRVLMATMEYPSRPAAEIIAEVLEATIRNFPWPKSMRWGSGTLRWVRPLHSILCILTDEAGTSVVPMTLDTLTTCDSTEGHRFMAPGRFPVTSFEDYEARLKRAHVMLNPAERADHIWADATNLAFAAGLEVVEDKGLLAEVAGLVEWPVTLMGEIDAEFLDLPPEVLQTSMREHQKFFSVRNPKSGRIERFVTVANRDTADQGATILAGNQKVLSARLSDAKFFWENDLRVAKSDMSIWTQSLENVTFHNKLGSQGDRIRRIAALSRELAGATGADADKAETAANLAKADLSSEMVYEFPELQGLMGRYYVESAGHPAEVAAVAQEHYSPLGPSDDVPTAPLSVTVALADKLDTLTGFWAIDEKPTGSKDPFALRRAALGVIRLVLENEIQAMLILTLEDEIYHHLSSEIFSNDILPKLKAEISAAETFGASVPDFLALRQVWLGKKKAVDISSENAVFDFGEFPEVDASEVRGRSKDLLAFIHDRLKVYLRDQGIRHDIIDACIAMPGNDDLTLLVKRARALNDVLATEDGENLLQGFKRANNILSQAEKKDGVEYSYGADVKFAERDSEKALFAALDAAKAKIDPALDVPDFPTAMASMAALRVPIDAFFEDVQVNTDSEVLRRNRLNLLSQIRSICTSVADLTRIEG